MFTLQILRWYRNGIQTTSPEPCPVIVVGGGSILVPDKLCGASEVVRPPHFEVANAIGAAIAQVSGEIERVFSLESLGREEALRQAKDMAVQEAIKAGAAPSSIEIVEVTTCPWLTFLVMPHG